MEKRQRESEGEREREKVRRGEKAGTRSHLSLLSHCWKQSRQTLCDRRDGGGGYEALFREELASLSLKRNTVKRASFLLEKMTRLPARRAMRRHGHFIFRQLIHLCGCLLPRVTPSSRLYTLSALTFTRSPTFSTFSRLIVSDALREATD